MLRMYLHDQYANYRKQLDHMNTLIIKINQGLLKKRIFYQKIVPGYFGSNFSIDLLVELYK